MEAALKSGVKEIAVFGAASEAFTQKNIKCSIAESIKRFEAVMEMAKSHDIKVRGHASWAALIREKLIQNMWRMFLTSFWILDAMRYL